MGCGNHQFFLLDGISQNIRPVANALIGKQNPARERERENSALNGFHDSTISVNQWAIDGGKRSQNSN